VLRLLSYYPGKLVLVLLYLCLCLDWFLKTRFYSLAEVVGCVWSAKRKQSDLNCF